MTHKKTFSGWEQNAVERYYYEDEANDNDFDEDYDDDYFDDYYKEQDDEALDNEPTTN